MIELTLASRMLLYALKNAKCGQDIFEAFQQIPTDKLREMHDMLIYILGRRDIHLPCLTMTELEKPKTTPRKKASRRNQK